MVFSPYIFTPEVKDSILYPKDVLTYPFPPPEFLIPVAVNETLVEPTPIEPIEVTDALVNVFFV